MSKLQLAVKTDIDHELPQQIIFNFDELKAELAATLEKYQNLVVTEETMKEAKATRADLNRLKKAMNDNRISIGKAWNAPYDNFKGKVDELIKMVDEPTAEIDKQVKAFEQAERDDKAASIAEFYEHNVKDLRDLLPLERVFDDKWLNKGVLLNTATNALFDRMEAVRREIETIQAMTIEHKDFLLAAYLRTLNIGQALDERRVYEEEQQALKRRSGQQARQETSQEPPPQAQQAPPTPPPAPQEQEEPRDLGLRFYQTTRAFRQELKAVAQRHGIKYEGGIINGGQ